jgi:stalled ribosome alternative rescue factor ArfA
MQTEKITVSLRDIAVRKGTASKVSKVEKPKKGKGSFKRQVRKFDLENFN